MTTNVSELAAQSQIEAFKNKDYAAIKAMLAPELAVKVDGGKKISGKNSGFTAIKQSLDAFAPVKLEMRHKGSSESADNNYLIGTLINAKNEKMRLFINLENHPGGKLICDVKMRRS